MRTIIIASLQQFFPGRAWATVLLALFLIYPSQGADVAWNGGAGDNSWQNPLNWSGNQVPAAQDDVAISGANVGVYVTSSVAVHGLVLSQGVGLAIQGTGVVFTATGPTRLDGANLDVEGGATLSLPGLIQASSSAVTNDYVNWYCSGAGSVLDLPGLTNLIGSPSPWYMEISVDAGGRVSLGGQFGLLSGAVRWVANDTNSVLEAAGLRRLAPNYLEVEAYGGARLSLPSLVEYIGTNSNRGRLYWGCGGSGSVLEAAALTNLVGSPAPSTTQFEVGGGGRMTLGGAFAIPSGGVSLNVSDTNTLFEAAGLHSIGQVYLNVYVQGGAHVSLPGLQQWLGGDVQRDNPQWTCTGPNSVLMITNLTNFAASPYPRTTLVQAQAGGQLILGGGFNVDGGQISLTADGTNSVLAVPGLKRLAPSAAYVLADHGGWVSLPALAEWRGDNIDHDNARWISSGVGSLLEATNLTNFTGSLRPLEVQVTAQAGGQLRLGGAFSIGGGGVNWAALGSNSVFQAPGLRRLAPNYCYLHAENGGRLSLLGLTEFVGANPDRGSYYWSAIGSGSLLEAGGLTNFVGTPDPWSTQVSATQGGQVNLGGGFSIPSGSVYLDIENTNSVIQAPGLRRLAPNNLNLSVQSGAHVSLPGLQEWVGAQTGGDSPQLTCDGAGTVLELPNLTNFVGSTYPAVTQVAATGGARMTLGGGFSILTGRVSLSAEGTNSVLEAPGLQRLAPAYAAILANLGGRVSLNSLSEWRGENIDRDNATWTSSGTGSLLEATNLAVFTGSSRPREVQATAQAGGQLRLGGAFNLVTGGVNWAALGSNSVLQAPGLQRLAPNYCYLHAEDGGLLSLLALREFSGANPDRGAYYWRASGAGSVLQVALLTNFTGSPDPWVTDMAAQSGGHLALGGQYSMSSAGVTMTATGTNSVFETPGLRQLALDYLSIRAQSGGMVSLPDLQAFAGDAAHRDDVIWDSQGTGSVVSAPNLSSFTASPYPWTTRVGARDGGRVSLGGAFDLVSGGLSFYASGAGSLMEAPALHRLEPRSFGIDVEAGGRVSLPALGEYSGVNTRLDWVYWTADGAGSLISLPALTNLVAPQNPTGMDIRATTGGKIDLGAVPAINSGSIYVLADGAGSSVDLHAANRFDTLAGSGSLRALNTGSIALGPIFAVRGAGLETVAAWGQPAITADASTGLMVCANPGLSFVVEIHPVGSPDSAWERFARIPVVTNQFFLGPIPGSPSAVEFRVRELLANPPELDLGPGADGVVRLTVFGLPGASYRLDVSPTAAPTAVWTPGQQVNLTHSFQQLDFTPPAPPMQFYRAVRQ